MLVPLVRVELCKVSGLRTHLYPYRRHISVSLPNYRIISVNFRGWQHISTPRLPRRPHISVRSPLPYCTVIICSHRNIYFSNCSLRPDGNLRFPSKYCVLTADPPLDLGPTSGNSSESPFAFNQAVKSYGDFTDSIS